MSQRGRFCLLAAAVVTLLWLVGCDGVGVPSTSEPAEVAQTSTSVPPPAATATEASEATPAISPSPVRRGRCGPVVFSSDFDDTAGEPVDVGLTFEQGIFRLYAYWPYEDVEPGERFRWDFYHDEATSMESTGPSSSSRATSGSGSSRRMESLWKLAPTS